MFLKNLEIENFVLTMKRHGTLMFQLVTWSMVSFFAYSLVSGFYGAFTLDVKSVLNENLGGILGGT
jgi:hypothetical protein